MSTAFFSSVFMRYYKHVFIYFDAFAFTIPFRMSLLSILNIFHTLIYFFLSCIKSRKQPLEVVFKKRCSLKLRIV